VINHLNLNEMKAKSILLIGIMLLVTDVTYSQVSFGVRAGVNFQNLNGENADGKKYKNDLKTGFNAGVEVSFPIAEDFFVQSGLLFSMKGSKGNDFGGNEDLSLSYVDLPVHLVYKPMLGTGRLILGFGPYVAYAVAGKYSVNGQDEDIKFENDVDLMSSGITLKRFDAGADLFFGYEFPFKLSVQLNTQLGLLNILPKIAGEKPDATVKNTGFGVSLGYRF
jgi:hypothetical protein